MLTKEMGDIDVRPSSGQWREHCLNILCRAYPRSGVVLKVVSLMEIHLRATLSCIVYRGYFHGLHESPICWPVCFPAISACWAPLLLCCLFNKRAFSLKVQCFQCLILCWCHTVVRSGVVVWRGMVLPQTQRVMAEKWFKLNEMQEIGSILLRFMHI